MANGTPDQPPPDEPATRAAADQARLAHNAMVRTMAVKKGIA